jgi:nitrite reductase/ring-hydroxylating ferredoxin subunit
MSAFHPTLPVTDVPPGTPRSVMVAGEPVCLVRIDDGLFAFDDWCPHRGTPLSQGRLQGTTLTCAAHTWEFDVRTGKLLRLRAPACLRMRAARERAGMIEVAE